MQQWQVLPTLAVRTTGFPVEMLQGLRFTRSVQPVRDLLDVERQLTAAQHDLLRRQLPAAVARAAGVPEARPLLKLLSTWRHLIRRGRALPPSPPASTDSQMPAGLRNAGEGWNALLERQVSARAVAEAAWTADLAAARSALWALGQWPRLLEAIFVSNPDVYDALSHATAAGRGAGPRTSATRRLERSLVSYVQRLCAKNETASFFGPINYGRIDPSQGCTVRVERSAAAVRRRSTFPSQWMVEALAEAISADTALEPYLRPRRGTRWHRSGVAALEDTLSGARLSLDPASAALVDAADGTHTVAELAASLGLTHQACRERLERFERAGVLVTRLLVPGDRCDPLAYLRDWLAAVPASAAGRWTGLLADLQREIGRLSDDDLPARIERQARIEALFSDAVGRHPRRAAGAMYADRGLVFEECLGDLQRCVLGGELAHTIDAKLAPILCLWQAAARLRAERDQRAAQAVWRAAGGCDAGDSVPLLRYVAAAGRYRDDPGARGPDRLDALLEQLSDLVRRNSDGHRARLSSAELPRVELPTGPQACTYTSVDLLVDAPGQAALQDGDFQLVVGEGHAPPLIWVFPTAHFLDEHDPSFGAALHAALAEQPGSEMAAQVCLARDSKIFPLPLPGASIELRPNRVDCRAIPASAVHVRADPHVHLVADGRPLQLYAPLKRRGAADPIAALGFPAVEMLSIDTGRHTPRIEIDGIVYQRERWRLPGGPIGGTATRDFELFEAAWRWKDQHGLPDEIFVRFSHEPKPIYVDLRNHFLVELLDHLARQSTELLVSEMVPSTSGAWLEGPEGHYSAEYRTVAIARP